MKGNYGMKRPGSVTVRGEVVIRTTTTMIKSMMNMITTNNDDVSEQGSVRC